MKTRIRRSLASLVLMLVPIQGMACETTLLTALGWTIEPINDRRNQLDVELVWSGDQIVRMVDGSVQFSDVLGGRIASFALTRDQMMIPGRTFWERGAWGPATFERLLEMNADDVVVTTCLRGVVYDDGTVVRFDQ